MTKSKPETTVFFPQNGRVIWRITLGMASLFLAIRGLLEARVLHSSSGIAPVSIMLSWQPELHFYSLQAAWAWWPLHLALAFLHVVASLAVLLGWRYREACLLAGLLLFSQAQRQPLLAELHEYWLAALLLSAAGLELVPNSETKTRWWPEALHSGLAMSLPMSLAWSVLWTHPRWLWAAGVFLGFALLSTSFFAPGGRMGALLCLLLCYWGLFIAQPWMALLASLSLVLLMGEKKPPTPALLTLTLAVTLCLVSTWGYCDYWSYANRYALLRSDSWKQMVMINGEEEWKPSGIATRRYLNALSQWSHPPLWQELHSLGPKQAGKGFEIRRLGGPGAARLFLSSSKAHSVHKPAKRDKMPRG